MADERSERPDDDEKPTGDGPYRSAPLRLPKRRTWIPWAIGGTVATLALIAGVLWPTADPGRPSLSSLPTDLFDAVTGWPSPEPDLPPSTPLAPLLVAAQPDALAVLSPGEGATRLRRGESLWVRFNRPMVTGSHVDRPLDQSPLIFDPPIAGQARWTSRSTISFTPAPDAFPSGVRESRLAFAPELASLSGEALVDDLERVIVLDGAPRVIAYRSQGRVPAGAALPLVFDSRVDLSALRSEMLAYEIGGGQRSLAVALGLPHAQPEDGYRVDVRLARALEPGARVALALAPRYQPWGGASPAVMTYDLAPRPQIEGIACQEGAAYAGQCSFQESPGRVIDIGPTLRLLASARLASLEPTNIRVTPALHDMTLRLAPFGPPERRLIEIGGEWEPDQVYEVRVSGLRTEEGEPVRPLPPLAVRSAGHPPAIRVASGHLTYERDAESVLRFAAIHPSASDVLHRGVPSGDELAALVSPGTFVAESGTSIPLAPLLPSARDNRWGDGSFVWRDETRPDAMAVVSFRPDPSRNRDAAQTAFVQSTDLGVTLRASADELLVWVTRLSSAEPVRGARITVADAQAHASAEGVTDADGVARIDLDANPLLVTHAIRVVHGDERAALLLDPRRAVAPAGMGLTPGAAPAAGAPVATVFTDRGAYRPGESLHAKITLRQVTGERARAVTSGRFVARLFGPSGAAPIAERDITPSRFGTASIDLALPIAADLGDFRIEVARHGRQETLGSASLRVAEFRQPTFRVDLSPIAEPVHAGDHVASDASATYLFGAPVTSGQLRWSLVKVGGAAYPERWSRYVFTSVGASAGYGTLAEGEEALGPTGAIHLDAQVALDAPARTTVQLEAVVTDGAGHTQAARRSFVAYPAAVEVGLREGGDWVELGSELDLDAVAIDHEGEPALGQVIEARIVREGWHSWWEWSQASHGPREGSYQLRRDRQREVVHRCRLTSAADPVRCAFTPPRSGTYVLEVEARDAAGRVSQASRRVYVAGPDEQPDRDPPGAPITVTPVRGRWTVGETAELAFESPFERAEALITVEREGVIQVERRQVGAGGQVIRIPIRAAMVPNVYVGVTLVKPRTGPPGESIDLHAPDLRFGVAELTVMPRASELRVALELPESARPGTDVPVSVRVTDARGRPVRGEVALWAVDEGTLRLTGYQVPDPTRGVFRPRPAAFAWEDLRRQLVSRVEPPPVPAPSGDGGEGGPRRTLDDRERFDPTPLWAPALVTDAQGRASATIHLPERPTEYRVMAVALDARASSGRASSALVAEQPLVIRPALPRFLTAGDRVEASVFVHNATEVPLDARVWATIGGERREARTIAIPAGGEGRVAEAITAPGEGPLAVRFDAEAGGEATALRDEIAIVPRGRYVRSQVVGAARGTRELTVGLPEGTPRLGASARVTVASHPFVGFGGAAQALLDSGWSGTEPIASTLLGLCAYDELGIADAAYGLSDEELDARGRAITSELVDQQNVDGGFGRWSSSDATMPSETAMATDALSCAKERGWLADQEALDAAREALIPLANGAAFGDWYGEEGLDRNAYALHVLGALGAPQEARASAIYEQRDRLSPVGLAQLALALGPEDARTDTLVLDAIGKVLVDREDEARDPSVIRWNERTARVYAAVLEAASRSTIGHARAGELAGRLLALRYAGLDQPWGTPMETARALRGLAAYARLWAFRESEAPRVLLDGHSMPAVATTRAGAVFQLPFDGLQGSHRLRIAGADSGPVFFAIDGRYAVPLGETDEVARGRRVTVHRVYETPDGRRLEDGAAIPLGSLVRVRLFVYTEEGSPEVVSLRDPLPAGFEAVDAADETAPREALMSLIGMGPDDDVVDARAQIAMSSIDSIAHRIFATGATGFFFDRLPDGLAEYTSAIRATAVGEFTAPPSQVEALYDPEYVARGPTGRLTVVSDE